jgi:hypothetical protein
MSKTALIRHLRGQGVRASRDEEFTRVSVLVDVRELSLDKRVEWVVARLVRNKASWPARKKTLVASLHALCQKKLDPAEVEQLVEKLIVLKRIAISPQGHITYSL